MNIIQTNYLAFIIVIILAVPLLMASVASDFVVVHPLRAEEVSADKLKQIKSGRGKAQLCTRCHGRLGMVHAISKNNFDGTVEAFVIKELVDFRTGARVHAVMTSISQTLTDQDINDVAAWYQAVSVKK